MSAYVIFDVEIRDMTRYQEFMKGVKPALDAAGARYLARGGAHRVYEGDWRPAGSWCWNSHRLPLGSRFTTARSTRG
jgi:uncharacterized protein (DUF1330 family)